MLSITKYGLIGGLSTIIGFSFLQKKSINLIYALLFAVIIQPYLCPNCKGNFSLSAFLGIFPILLLFFFDDCNTLKNYILIFSIMCAFGRVGCYFAGCCTGKPCSSSFPLGIKYTKGSTLIDKYYKNKRNLTVYPTIFLEVIIQLFISYLIWISKYGNQIYGVSNALLLLLTSYWRDQPRPNTYFSIFTLLLFSVLSYLLCGKVKKDCCLNWNPDIIALIAGIIVMYVLSNDLYTITDILTYLNPVKK